MCPDRSTFALVQPLLRWPLTRHERGHALPALYLPLQYLHIRAIMKSNPLVLGASGGIWT